MRRPLVVVWTPWLMMALLTLLPPLALGTSSSPPPSSTPWPLGGCLDDWGFPDWCSGVVWVMWVGFISAFALSFGTGANDVANAFGTTVGAKVLTLRNACILATFFELLGAALIGYKVSDTMRKGIFDTKLYEGSEKELMLGCLSALTGSAIWLIVATFLKLPISGTHSIVGATVGFSLVAKGTEGVGWSKLLTIVASWFVSPVMSGIVSVGIYVLIRHFILLAPNPMVSGLHSLPLFYSATIMVNVFSVIHDGPKLLHLDNIPWWGALVASIIVGILSALVVQFFIVPYQRKKILQSSRDPSPQQSKNISTEDMTKLPPEVIELEPNPIVSSLPDGGNQMYCFPQTNGEVKPNGYLLAASAGNPLGAVCPEVIESDKALVAADRNTLVVAPHLASGQVTPACGLSPNSSAVPLIKPKNPRMLSFDSEAGRSGADGTLADGEGENVDSPEVASLFSFLQILTATFGSFAHGGNDVSNAIGPLIALWLIYHEGSVHQKSETPIYILLYGGVGISVGLWLWGRRVIQTIGEDLTKITPSTGFTIEIGAASTVLLASKIGLPISTTHCKVGSVVFVGWACSSKKGVDWKLFRNIIYAWVVTIPVAGGLSAAIMAFLRAVAL
ncbi:sodium-dependent phosphate transporter 1-B isoform X2 [Hetaerina americana]|uniref:sodium-dependent phosphate transporter 1-B isoform X2 n=1 Tax=Hetaerina americana TaxID=62018 RepID=UPI003A7F0FF6